MYPKLMLNKLNVMGILPLFIIIGYRVQRSVLRNLQPTCSPCVLMCDLRVNKNSTKSGLRFN